MMAYESCKHVILKLSDQWVRQSNAFDRSVSAAEYSSSWSKEVLNFSIIAIKQFYELKAFQKPVWHFDRYFWK